MVMLFYVNLALSGVLIAALLSIKPVKPFRWSLAIVLGVHLCNQGLYLARITGSKDAYPLLSGLTFPLQIVLVIFLDRFFQLFTPGQRHEVKTPRLFIVALVFSVIWYAVAQISFSASELSYGLAHKPWNLVRFVASCGVALFAVERAVRSVGTFQRWANANFSNLAQLRLPALRGIVGYFVLMFLIGVFDFVTGPETQLFVWIPFLFAAGVSIFTVYCLKVSTLLVEELSLTAAQKLGPEEIERIHAKLTRAMQADKLYLNPELRLTELASVIGERPYKVTMALTRGIGQSFNDYVNTFRTEHAKRLLKGPEADRFNLIGIAMDSGFNSKSVFNDVFKKMTGVTPSAFRGTPVKNF